MLLESLHPQASFPCCGTELVSGINLILGNFYFSVLFFGVRKVMAGPCRDRSGLCANMEAKKEA